MASSNTPDPGATPQPPPSTGNVPTEKEKVFISYGHDEKVPPDQKIAPLIERLEKDLQARGFDLWIDFEHLYAGSDWEFEIKSAIQSTRRFVLLMTPYSVSKEAFCRNELFFAIDLGVPIVPVLVIQCQRPLCIYATQYLKMVDCLPFPEREKQYEAVLAELIKALQGDRSQPFEFSEGDSKVRQMLLPSTVEIKGQFKLHQPYFTGRKWVFDRLNTWLQDTDPDASRVFLIKGLAGTGKSAIAARFCVDRPDLVVGFHICRHNDLLNSDPLNFVRSIAYQLSTQIPEYEKILSELNWEPLRPVLEGATTQAEQFDHAVTLFNKLIGRELHRVAPPNGLHVIVVDALDEAERDGSNPLVELIAKSFEDGPTWLRLLATTRPDSRVTAALSRFDLIELIPDTEENQNDIRDYATRRLAEIEGDEVTRNNAIEAIVDRSGGIFLYARWVCYNLKKGYLKIDQISTFPRGLDDVYHQFFRRLYPDAKAYAAAKPFLGIMTVACDAVPEQLIFDLFQLNEDTSKPLLDPLAPLFPKVGNSYRPFHKSILDWLSAKKDPIYSVDTDDSQKRLAEYCWSKCKERVQSDPPWNLSRKQYQQYWFRYGVRHLIASRRFAEAVELLDYLLTHNEELSPEECAELDQQAKLMTIALGDKKHPVTAQEAAAISPKKLAARIQNLYMTEPLRGGIEILARYHPAELDNLLNQMLATNDYVLRYAVAEALATVYIDIGDPKLLTKIEGYLSPDRDLNTQELGAYALTKIYANKPRLIEDQYLNLLANGAIYPFRSALGDMLIALTLEGIDKDPEYAGRLALMDRVDKSSRFWNPIWQFNRMDVAALRAIQRFARKQPPLEEEKDVRDAYDALVRTDELLEIVRKSVGKDAAAIDETLGSYYHLGVQQDLMPEDAAAVKDLPGLQQLFEVLFAYPLWDITESAASLLASVVDQNPSRAGLISTLFSHNLWRVKYGAAEAAFLARFSNRNQLFEQAIRSFYNHPEPLLRGNIAENLGAWILDTMPEGRAQLLDKFEAEITHWLMEENEDAWVLDHLYRLFHHLWDQGRDMAPENTSLMRIKVSSLLAGDPVWYTLERQQFLLQIEERQKRKRQRAA